MTALRRLFLAKTRLARENETTSRRAQAVDEAVASN